MLHRNLGFKLLALALAVVLWLVLVVREDMSRQAASAPVGAIQGAPLFGEDRFARAVPIVPQVQGVPADGYELVGLHTRPTVVALVGAEKDLQRISSVITEPINIAGLRGEREVGARLVVPDKMALLGEPSVQVTVVTKPIAQRVPTAVPHSGNGD